MRVKDLRIREVLATNTEKTVEVEIETKKGIVRSSVPIGTSKGRHEVKYLPIEDVLRKFHLIKRQFLTEVKDQKDVDETLRIIDKTPDFRYIGGNLALAISSAFLKVFALEAGQEVFEYLSDQTKEKINIPKPVCNIIGGGKHLGRIDIQEFHLIPVHQKSFLDSITKIASAYRTEGKELRLEDPTFVFAKNIESAWVSNLSFEEILKMMTKVANEYLLKLGIDFAASELWDGNQYYVYRYSNKVLSTIEQLRFIKELIRTYPIIYLEDPFHEDDFVSFSILTHETQPKLIVGDDLYSTNLKRLKDGIDFKATNAVIIKPNQIGTITDTIEFIKEAKKHRMITVVSHRSGETEDTLICHLAVGLGCDYIKLGISGERTTKINEIIRIEEKVKI
ncbi:MAG: enolase [Candidatus Aenigmatarchaeota archaeon]